MGKMYTEQTADQRREKRKCLLSKKTPTRGSQSSSKRGMQRTGEHYSWAADQNVLYAEEIGKKKKKKTASSA